MWIQDGYGIWGATGLRTWAGRTVHGALLRWPASATLSPMVTFRARVENGRIVVCGTTNLPEGTEVMLVVVDDADELTTVSAPTSKAKLRAAARIFAPARQFGHWPAR